ncbi:MAG: 50S ribosomal protein L29 [Candidatus Zixiibacteriota bacterium]
MKMESLRDLTRDELLQKRHELKDEYFNLKMRKSLKELDNPLKLRTLRRDIARIETILTEDREGIRKIVDSRVSILGKSGEEKVEPPKGEEDK